MNHTDISLIATKIDSAAKALERLRGQRMMLGTGNGSCMNVCVKVIFTQGRDEDFKLNAQGKANMPLLPCKEMVALALCKSWDEMIAAQEKKIAALSAQLASVTGGR